MRGLIMDVGFKLEKSSYDAQTITDKAAPIVKWSDFRLSNDFHQLPGNKTHLTKSLQGTNLACGINSDVARWENRVEFIEKIVSDIITHCPKDEELFVVSIGSNQLLQEYIIGKTLIEKGYKKLMFLMVDPRYLGAGQNKNDHPYLTDFQNEIDLVYKNVNREPIGKENIRFLTRAQNIQKYFTDNANVIIIESLPPYSEVIKDMNRLKIDPKKEEDLLSGSRIVPLAQANTVSFVYKDILEIWKAKGTETDCYLPTSIFKLDAASPFKDSFASSHYIVDWGCKIYRDGSCSVSFTGAKRYFASIRDRDNQLLSKEKVEGITQVVLNLLKNIRTIISERVKEIKKDNPNELLSQQNVSDLLQIISKLSEIVLPVKCFYTADYVVDRTEALKYLSMKAGHHYRKRFQLLAHPETDYEIVEKQI